MKIHDAERRDAFGIWGLSIETYARHNPREVAFDILSPNMDAEAVRNALKHHVSAFHFLLYRMAQKLFGLLHEYTMWSIGQPCTDVTAEVAPQEPFLWLLRHHGAPTHLSGPIYAS